MSDDNTNADSGNTEGGELILGKFKSTDDLSKAYSDLQSEFGKKSSKLDSLTKELETLQSKEVNPLSEEQRQSMDGYFSGGELTDELAELISKTTGFDRTAIESFDKWQQSERNAQKETIQSALSEFEGVTIEAVVEHMESTLSEDEFKAYDVLLKKGKTGFLKEFAQQVSDAATSSTDNSDSSESKPKPQKGNEKAKPTTIAEYMRENVDMNRMRSDSRYARQVRADIEKLGLAK